MFRILIQRVGVTLRHSTRLLLLGGHARAFNGMGDKPAWPDESAVGRLIGPEPPGLRVVGVVALTRQSDLTAGVDPAGIIYLANAAFRNELTIMGIDSR